MGKKLILLLVVCTLLIGCGKKKEILYQTISRQDTYQAIEDSSVTILDVRTIEEYTLEHIENAIHVPVEEISKVKQKIPDVSRKIIVYCRTGVRSKKAAETLISMGYEEVYDMKGGMSGWTYEMVK